MGPRIEWRRDWRHGGSTPLSYFRFIPYLDFDRAGDHKAVWELNRHQQLVLLAQAWRLSGDRRFLDEIARQLGDWLDDNPFQRGINWTSALEAAFRALSWIWVWHLTGEALESGVARRLLEALHRHGLYIENNLSIYFSPNTHLLGEALTLYVLGALFDRFPRATGWKRRGDELMREQLDVQVRADGSHFEQSIYYHVYTLDIYLLYAALARPEPPLLQRLRAMAGYLDAAMGGSRRLPKLGDDDGGRLFHPYGDRSLFGRATLATAAVVLGETNWSWSTEDVAEQAAWWLGVDVLDRVPRPCPPRESRWFADAGLAVMIGGDVQVLVDAGPFGHGTGGHSHSDTLSLIVRHGDAELLWDAGTYQYVGPGPWRDLFRGTAAHNTVRVDGRDQATPRGPFGWTDPTEARMIEWITGEELDYLDAECRFRIPGGECRHRRRVVLFKQDVLLVVLDLVEGPPGEHLVEQFWHADPRARLRLDSAARIESGGELGWRSSVFGTKDPAPVLCASLRKNLPVRLAAALDLSTDQAGGGAPTVECSAGQDAVRFGDWKILFPLHGLPSIAPWQNQ
jgi:hypothetical protein